MNLARLITRPARRAASLAAITAGGTRWSYGELARRVARTAAALVSRHGLRAGDRVALALENRPEFFQILFGCWHAGLVAVPMNAKLHAKELAYILDDSGAALCVASPALAAGIAAASGEGALRLLSTDERDFAALLDGDAGDPAEVAPDAPAWLFYTSGTTGRPKGAVLTARNLLFMTNAYYADIDRVAPGDTMIHAAPLSHGSGLYALPHLAQGGHQLIPESGHFDAAEMLGLMARRPQVSLFAAPTMVVRLVNSPAAGGFDPRNLATIVYGGAPMYVADLKRALELFGPKLVQIYGQGESPMTIASLSKADHAEESRLGSCGVARTGVDLRVVDAEDRDLPPGAVGEVVTQSDCVMAGYWRNPAASAETLRGGWLHTGDVGALDEQGYLTLKDRSKDVIISGGSNIYPREVEEVLLLDPRVAEASVIGAAHAEWGEEVVAFVVAAGVTAAELDRLCLDHVARFKRPRRYVFLDALPKNNYGKILKTELRRRLTEERG